MDIFSVAVIAILAVIFAVMLKRTNKEYSLLITIFVCVIILIFIIDKFSGFVLEIESFIDSSFIKMSYITVLLKAVGVTIIGQITSNICKDAGENAIAFSVETATKFSILLISLPIISEIFSYLIEIMKI